MLKLSRHVLVKHTTLFDKSLSLTNMSSPFLSDVRGFSIKLQITICCIISHRNKTLYRHTYKHKHTTPAITMVRIEEEVEEKKSLVSSPKHVVGNTVTEDSSATTKSNTAAADPDEIDELLMDGGMSVRL